MTADQIVNTVSSGIAAIMVILSLITGLTKTQKDDVWYGKVYEILARLFSWTTHRDAGGTFKLPGMAPAPPKD